MLQDNRFFFPMPWFHIILKAMPVVTLTCKVCYFVKSDEFHKLYISAKDSPVAIGVSHETDLDATDIEDEEEDSKRKPDALGYFSDNGAISSPARKDSEEYVQTYGQGKVTMESRR